MPWAWNWLTMALNSFANGVLQIARLRREEGDRVVAPVVAQALLDQIAVVDEGVDRQQLGAGDAERAQIGRNVRMGQAREGAAIGFRTPADAAG